MGWWLDCFLTQLWLTCESSDVAVLQPFYSSPSNTRRRPA